jgi:hypothetical protein
MNTKYESVPTDWQPMRLTRDEMLEATKMGLTRGKSFVLDEDQMAWVEQHRSVVRAERAAQAGRAPAYSEAAIFNADMPSALGDLLDGMENEAKARRAGDDQCDTQR